MKKQSIGNIMLLLALVFAAAGTVIYCINTHGGYYHDFTPMIVVLAVVSMVVLIVLKVLSAKLGDRQWLDLFYVLGAVLYSLTAVKFIASRVESAGIILGSDLEAGNALASQSLYMAFVGIGCFVIGMILIGVAGFFDLVKKDAD